MGGASEEGLVHLENERARVGQDMGASVPADGKCMYYLVMALRDVDAWAEGRLQPGYA